MLEPISSTVSVAEYLARLENGSSSIHAETSRTTLVSAGIRLGNRQLRSAIIWGMILRKASLPLTICYRKI